MRKNFTIKTMFFLTVMLMAVSNVWAGDGTKANPYTVAELNAKKQELQDAASSMLPFQKSEVWVKADLKGLGEDGTLTENANTEEVVDGKTKTIYNMAGLFGDSTGETFVAYSWQILGQLAMEDLTNTKDLLICLTYQQHSHTYANKDNVWQGQEYEPDDFHSSLVEVHGALSLEIKNGYRGFHIPSCFEVPEGVCAAIVSAGYSSSKGAYMNYRYFDGADSDKHVTLKNSAVVLMAKDGKYDFVLTTDYYEPVMGTNNSMYGGTVAGENKGTKANRARLRFVNDGKKVGFERNNTANSTVNLESKDEVYLEVSSLASNFYGKYEWESEDKTWITWAGGTYEDQHKDNATFDFTTTDLRNYIGETASDVKGWVYNETYKSYFITLQAVTGTSPNKLYADNNRGNCFVIYKDGILVVRAPKGNAVKKVEFAVAGTSNINKLTPSAGAFEGLVWTGNAEGVRFTQGATSYLSSIAVTIGEKDDATTALPEIEYVSCSNIGEFNALADGTYARVQITDAQVIGKSADGITTAWIQDATGGAAVKYTCINDNLTEGKRIFGSFVVKKSSNQMREAEGGYESEALPQDLEGDLNVVEGSLADLNVAANLNRLVKITGASFAATSATAGTLTQGGASIAVNNGNAASIDMLNKITDKWEKDVTKMENVTIIAILTTKNATTNQLLPISMVSDATGISNVNANTDAAAIYNLQGVRLKNVQRGINIVNGVKVFIK